MSGAGESYFAAYALFLGASAAQVSLLAAIPPLFGAVVQLLAVWLERRLGSRHTLILCGAFMHALTWFPIIWLPHFFPAHAIPLMVSCVVLYYGWIGLGAPLWAAMMGELVPPHKRGRYFGWRTQLMSISSFVALLLGGLALEYFEVQDDARLGFMLLFTVAAGARLYSVYHLARMREPPKTGRAIADVARPRQPFDASFVRFSAFLAATNFAVAVAGPFFTIYMLRDLKLSYLQFTLATAVTVGMQFLTLRVWGRLADVFGNRAILLVTGLAVPIVPALWMLSTDFLWVLFLQAFAGWSWAGFTLAAGNYLYDIVPTNRPSHWAAHGLSNSLGTCLGALLGGGMSGMFPHSFELFGYTVRWSSGLWGLMLTSAVLRAAVMLVFLPRIPEARRVREFSARNFIFRMIRYHRAAGFILDILGLGRRRTRAPRAVRPPNSPHS